MTILVINGKRVTVSDDFLALSPEDQSKTVDEIAASMGAQPSPQTQAAAPQTAPAQNPAGLGGFRVGGAGGQVQPSLIGDGAPQVEQFRPIGSPPPQAPAAPMSRTRAAILAAGQGASSNTTDEIVARIASISPNVTYEDALAQNQRTLAAGQQQFPVTSTASNVGGAIVQGAAMAAPRAVASLIGSLMPSTLAGKTIVGAGLGAAVGAATGAASGAGAALAGRRMEGAKEGATLGAVVGGGVGAAAPAVASGLRNALEYMKGRDVGAISRALGISRGAAEVVRRSLDADDFVAAERALKDAGPDAMLADAGPATSQLLDTTMQSGGRALRIGRDAVETRAAAAQGRITGVFDAVLGFPEGVRAASRGIAQRTAAIRQRAYDRAYAQPIDYASPQGAAIEGVLARVSPATLKQAVDEANAAMRDAGTRNPQIMATIGDAGEVSFTEMPNVQQLDELKRALDAIAQRETDAITGRITPAGRRAKLQASDLRAAIADANKPYAVAVRLGGDKIAEQTALDTGRALTSMPLERVREVFSGASKEALAAARQGFRSYIEDTMSTVRRTVADGNVEAREALKPIIALSSRDMQAKLEAFLTPSQIKALMGAVDEAAIHLGLRANVATNSKTAVRQAGQAAIEEVTTASPLQSLMQVRPVEAGRQIVQALTGAGPEIQTAAKQAAYAEIAQALTAIRGPQAVKALDTIQRAMRGQPVKRIEAEVIARLLTGGLAGGAYQQGTQSLSTRQNALAMPSP